VSAGFHLNSKEAKRELKDKYNNEILPFCSEPKYLRVTLDRSLTYRRHLESLRKKLTSRVMLLRWLAGSGWGSEATTPRITTLALVHSTTAYCAPVWCRSTHTHLINPATNDALRIVTGSNVLSFVEWSHTVSTAPCHRAWTSAPVSTHLSIKCRRMAPQIVTPICTRRTTSHQFI